MALPPKDAVEATLRGITDGPEPKTYEGRRDILEGIRDLRMNYLNGDLEISGKVPVYEPAESTGSGRKKCNRSIDSDDTSSSYIPFKIQRRARDVPAGFM